MTGFALAALETQAVRVSAKTIWTFVRASDRDGQVGWGEATLRGAADLAARNGRPRPDTDLAAAIERIAAVRAAIGDEARLMVDCHWRLDEQAALAVLDAAAPQRLHWLECAVAETPDLFAAMRRIRAAANRVGVLTAGCETMVGVEGFRPFLDAGVYDVVMPDVKCAGGLDGFLDLAALAAARGVACSPHNLSGPVCHAHSLHASAALPAEPMLEHQFDESPLFVRLVAR